ncbi:glycosyltransferase family 2 protein [Fodinibius salsisoli]|uniref:Glycosyltransferase family 2 protein n=1 Tax=Fodinibius salsisoli TaxID=2820877 RepID=A0ABT3PR14_9BACT|nr:glycosyltransferase family 2 protein [Fodinibius salsisoli]MCW9708276.1 glycosyltransferase family 2 protein [Fodinibius salsisoli]
MPSFSIIIVSWNALHHLKKYLPSVIATDYPNFEIILADNASTDGSKAWVREHYPKVKIAALEKNYGYCGGNNKAVPYADGDILLFLNNDVRVEPDWLHGLARCFEDPGIGAAQPKFRSDEEPEYFEYAGAAGGFLDKYGYPFCRGRIFDTVEKDYGQYDNARDVLWASGAALAIRKELFIEQKGFDEAFEFHMEEIDLCWRLWNAGYRVRYCPDSIIYHLGGGSLPMDSPRKVYYNYRNNLKMIWKNCSAGSLVRRFWIRYGLDIIATLRSLSTGNWKEAQAIIRAHYHFWQSFPSVHRQRQELQQRRTVADDPVTIMPVNIIKEYFLKSNKMFRELP